MLSVGLLRVVDQRLAELGEIRRTHDCQVGGCIAKLKLIRRYLSAERELTAIRQYMRARRARAFVVSRFNNHCPICGRTPETLSRWAVRPDHDGVWVQCRKCYTRDLRFRMAYDDIIQ